MKIQNLAVLFLLISIPLMIILSYYLHFKQETIRKQIEYDAKLAISTKDAIKAFEKNTIGFTENIMESANMSQRSIVQASINTFLISLSNNLNISGTSKEQMEKFVPAIIFNTYDGYYIYKQCKIPKLLKNNEGIQLFLDRESGTEYKIYDIPNELGEANDSKIPIYEPESNAVSGKYIIDESDPTNYVSKDFVSNPNDAKKEYRYLLNPKKSYSKRFKGSTNSTDVMIDFTLDNKIHIYGKDDLGENVDTTGYLVYFDLSNTAMSRISIDSSNNIDIKENKKQINNVLIKGEKLEEQIAYTDGGDVYIKNFNYVYDSEKQKIYYDGYNNFFYLDNDGDRVFLDSAYTGDIKYKTVSILYGDDFDTINYIKLYQPLHDHTLVSGKSLEGGQWYIDKKNKDQTPYTETNFEPDEWEKLSTADVGALDLSSDQTIDYSSLNYYVESYTFTKWISSILEKNDVDNNLFVFSDTNNPEDTNSLFYNYKQKIMKEAIRAELQPAISAYNGEKGRIPAITEEDLENIVQNVSFTAFFQGRQIGEKEYNNYSYAISLSNKEYVNTNELYFSGDDTNFHRINCEKCAGTDYTAYRSYEYNVKEFKTDTNTFLYYYLHDHLDTTHSNKNSETACYNCIINNANYKKTIIGNMVEAYCEAVGREKYIQNK